MERIRSESDSRQLLLGLHMHGDTGRSTRRSNWHEEGFRLQHAGIEFHHSVDAISSYIRLCRRCRVKSHTGIYAGTLLFFFIFLITISWQMCIGVRFVRIIDSCEVNLSSVYLFLSLFLFVYIHSIPYYIQISRIPRTIMHDCKRLHSHFDNLSKFIN